jgi:hypothetical protein
MGDCAGGDFGDALLLPETPMTAYLFSCENATCAVPEAFRETFRGSEEVVQSPEGWEPGALNLAQAYAMKFRTPLVHGDVTRLLIDFEKSGDDQWSRFSNKLPEATRAKLVDRHAKPYRILLKQRITEDLKRNPRCLHLMIHTAPLAEGIVRMETAKGAALAEMFADVWRAKLSGGNVDVRQIKGAEPTALAAELMAEFPIDRYAQIRIVVAQSFFLDGRPLRWDTCKKLLLDSVAAAVGEVNGPAADGQ